MSIEGAIAGVLCSGCCCASALVIIGGAAFVLLRKPSAPVARPAPPIAEEMRPMPSRAPVRPVVVTTPPVVEAVRSVVPPPVVTAPPVVEATKAVVVEEVGPRPVVEATKAIVAEEPFLDTGVSLPPDRPVEDAFSSRTMIPIQNLADLPPGGATIMVPPPVPLEGPDPATDVPEPPRALRHATIVPEDPKDEE